MGLMDKFADPSLFDSLSFGDKMAGSAITMLMGMGITFVVLMLLWGVFALMGKAMSPSAKKGDKASKAETKANATPSVAAPAAAKTDDVLTAVIAAAIAAYQSEGGTGNLVVRKIQRLSGETTLWTNAAREDCIESRRF
ncbi:MAG: OadG family protein [Firmicutes bacterium]|uniref:OadG family protein n=1 Tax=Lentihominibacter sp. TaxID=2944216 RepID=UPI002A52E0A5|nr:OadG family protein [Lentihominibacter sp.]MCI5853245.1 OadG family protein [Clostridiales bacterium]MDD7320549.1 OadG family protein [Bacillota bacterium]MDY5287296.1 OadG family protein [Lentihominibacter sp.]